MSESTAFPTAEGTIRVWWIPQIPGVPFEVTVSDMGTARLLCDVLARYDQFQFDHKIKPDYCNAGGIAVFRDGEWEDMDDDLYV